MAQRTVGSGIGKAPDISILGDNVGLHPSGYAQSPSKNGEDNSHKLIDTFASFRSAPLEFFREVSMHVNGTGWRAYSHPVGPPVYYPGFTENIKTRVLASPILVGKISQLASKRLLVERSEGLLALAAKGTMMNERARQGDLEAWLTQVAEGMLDAMICKMDSKTFIRSAYYGATQLLTRAYHQGIHVSSEEILRVRAVAEQAAKKKQSVIYLPSHRSHIDYISLQIISYRLGLVLPTVVAGDNLNFPLVGPFLQSCGAMYIRRTFGNDQLYSTTVQAYIDTLLQAGFPFQCFIEGTRSRTGKLLSPRLGILNFVIESLLSGRVEDAIVCPVSCQYDKVIEVDSYINELLGTSKQKENLSDFISASSTLNLRLGRVDVRFHECWSLREFINQQSVRYSNLPARISEKQDCWTQEKRVKILRALGYRVLSNINAVSVVMPTALVGTVILTLRGRGVGKSDLIGRVDWLRQRVINKGGRVAHFANLSTEAVVGRALEVLGDKLVGRVVGLPEETYYAVDRFQLSFYRNMTIHLFILEALVCAGLYTRVKLGGGARHEIMSHVELRHQVTFLSQLFRAEFIFPLDGLEVNMRKTLLGLEADDVLHLERDSKDQGNIKTIQLSNNERESGRENYDFYCFLIWPFIEAAWLGAISLQMLIPPLNYTGGGWIEAKVAQDNAQLLGKTLYHQGDLSYFEAVNKETLKNAYQRCEEEGMILALKSKDKRAISAFRLADDWLPQRNMQTGALVPVGKLWDFAEAISQSRREGKNRRDGRTVQKRVLHLVDVVGRVLWASQATRVNGTDARGDMDSTSNCAPSPKTASKL